MLYSVPSAGSSFWLCSNSMHASANLPALSSSRPRLNAASAGVGVCASAMLDAHKITIAISLLTAVTDILRLLLRRPLRSFLRRGRGLRLGGLRLGGLRLGGLRLGGLRLDGLRRN